MSEDAKVEEEKTTVDVKDLSTFINVEFKIHLESDIIVCKIKANINEKASALIEPF